VSLSNYGNVCAARPSTSSELRTAILRSTNLADKDGVSEARRQCAPFRRLHICGAFAKARLMNILLLAFVPVCFALNPITGRALADTFGPASLSLVRWLLSALIIGLIGLTRGKAERWRAPPRQVARTALLGMMAMGYGAYAAFQAARTTEATNIALIYSCASALVAAWEIAAGRQRASVRLLLGIAACLFGVVLILTRGHPEVVRDLRFTPGDLWAASGMGVFVVYTIAMRRTPATLTPLAQFTVMSLAATLVLLPLAIAEVASASLPLLDEATLAWIAVTVLATGIGAFLGYNASLRRNGPVLTSASLTLTPVFAAGMAMALIGETLAWYHAAAVALVVAGPLLINRGSA
jgi:drug/metabolite transporter (DMT)-like permease